MSSRRNSLTPPERRDIVDPGAHELAEASDSEEHYSDARSGPITPARASPIPKTRVERVDDKPAYGEVPGTQAYRLREEDAAPDEIAIIPDADAAPEPEQIPRSPTPGGYPVPKTVVEEAPDAEGSVTHPENRQRRKSDAHPDLVVKADGTVEQGRAATDPPLPSPSSLNAPATSSRTRRKSSSAMKRSPLSPGLPAAESAVYTEDADDDDSGDEFDDFEEGGEDGDFDDFEDGFQTPAQQQQQQPQQAPQPPPPPSAPAAPSLSFPIPTFDDLSPSEITTLTEPYLAALFPSPLQQPPLPAPSAGENPVFLTPRSASLWSQLVAPPPLQPPDWIRSRIRRLFLVSLGVPVDLDEILPASSKQKKLVLPSLHRTTSSGSLRRASSDSRGAAKGAGSASASAGEGGGRDSRAGSPSVGGDPTSASSSSRRRKKADASARQPSPERSFDLVSARQMCMLTDAALSGMTDAELRAHIARLEATRETAQGVLAYWQKRTDEKIGDREAFEGVIENLVKHARKVRK
ncbi:uncharacterized protein P884DRAFT_267200 [Thermothelomyces heterothallicus CBS 202.75]|uniref:uncharacterized protein n=1 Tax=Thermothelomyces heterothallicus CBS 202.75 TaxID=1149848 RepID=UPI0037433BA6